MKKISIQHHGRWQLKQHILFVVNLSSLSYYQSDIHDFINKRKKSHQVSLFYPLRRISFTNYKRQVGTAKIYLT